MTGQKPVLVPNTHNFVFQIFSMLGCLKLQILNPLIRGFQTVGLSYSGMREIWPRHTPLLFWWLLQSGKSWISSGCNQKCACTEGTIQCRAFHCPSRSHCKLHSNGNSNCVSESKERLWGEWRRGKRRGRLTRALGVGVWNGEAWPLCMAPSSAVACVVILLI